jgi:hypothetical protein
MERENENARLYEYAILWHPNKEQKKDGQKSKIVQVPTTILAVSHEVAQMIAMKAIPDVHTEELDQIDVAIRPF